MSSYRSSSQVSVYNYPEHLNPFYEDEQHKRLRFWKLKKNNSSSKNADSTSSGMRRGSFNFGSLRDLFPLRSFRVRKQSSSLGVNMTSESPPPLRRDLIAYNKEDEDKYAQYDPHFRHTIDQRAFQRNAPYRSSLQNMTATPNDLAFVRNNRYRSTIQNGSSMQHISTTRNTDGRYTYSGSITPTPRSRYLTDITPRMTPGSSMNSISTNPFDDDYDDEENTEAAEQNVAQKENSLSVPSSKKPAKRKKRRAPPPPTAVAKKATEDEMVQIRMNENNADNRTGLDELSRLTAEFESFVKNSQSDVHEEPKLIISEEEIITKKSDEKKTLKEEENISVKVEKTVSVDVEKTQSPIASNDRISQHHVVVRRELTTPDDKTISIIQEDLKIKEIELKIKEDELRIKEALEEVNNNKTFEIEKVVDKNLYEKKGHEPDYKQNCNENIKESTPDIQTVEVHQLTTEIRKFPEIQHLTPTPTPSRELTPDYIPLTVREKFTNVLRIEENENDIKKPEEIKEEKSMSNIQIQNIEDNKKESIPKNIENETIDKPVQVKILTQSNVKQDTRVHRDRTPIPLARTEVESKLTSQGFVRVEKQLKYDDFEKCTVRRQNSHTDNDDVILREDEAPKVPERRRSVKDIIESINRQQQKLKINQPPSPQLPRKKYYIGEQKFSYHEKPALPPKENVLLKLQRQAEQEKRINILLDDLQDYSKENHEHQPSRTHSFPVESDTNNNHMSFPQNINPIPKPRRII